MTILGVPLRIARVIVTVIVVLDLVALAGFAFHVTTTVTRTVQPLSETVPPAPTAPIPTPPATTGGAPGGGPIAVPVSDNGGTTTTSTKTHHQPAKPPHRKTKKPVAPPKTPIPPIKDTEIGKCPAKLAKPATMGGLQSLVPLAPAFGPFSAEAFAAASAYQPMLELLGPILAQYPKLAPKVAPLMNPVLKLFGAGSNQLFGLISPLYSPDRTQVLQAETKLAAFFAPYSKKLAGQPLAGCVVDLEASLVGDTKSHKSHASQRVAH